MNYDGYFNAVALDSVEEFCKGKEWIMACLFMIGLAFLFQTTVNAVGVHGLLAIFILSCAISGVISVVCHYEDKKQVSL